MLFHGITSSISGIFLSLFFFFFMYYSIQRCSNATITIFIKIKNNANRTFFREFFSNIHRYLKGTCSFRRGNTDDSPRIY